MISNLFNPPIQLLLYTIPDDCFPIAVDSRYTVILKAKLSIQNMYCKVANSSTSWLVAPPLSKKVGL